MCEWHSQFLQIHKTRMQALKGSKDGAGWLQGQGDVSGGRELVHRCWSLSTSFNLVACLNDFQMAHWIKVDFLDNLQTSHSSISDP